MSQKITIPLEQYNSLREHVEASIKILKMLEPVTTGGRKSPKVAALNKAAKMGKKAIVQHFIDTIK